MPTLSLPRRPTVYELKAFWLLVSLGSGAVAAFVLTIAVAPAWAPAGLLVAALVAVPGWIDPEIAAGPMRFWTWLSDRYVHLSRSWVMGVCFFVTITLTGRAGSRLPVSRARANGGRWVPRDPKDGGSGADPLSEMRVSRASWLRDYLRWGATDSNRWAWILLPFLIVLSLLKQTEKEDAPEGIYTLF